MAGPRWLFTKDQLSHTPSIKNGFAEEKESATRQQAANLIQTMGQKMQLSQLCMNTAIVYMHRFYMFQSLQRFPWRKMASAFIFLAAKVEEQPKKIEHVIRTHHYLHNRPEDGSRAPEIDIKSQEYLEKVQELVINENILLQTLGFKVTIDHSNTHVVKLCQLVKAPKDLSQLSYFLSTNSLLLTNLCLQYPPQVIAAVCIYLACKWADWELQRSKEGKDWWRYIVPSLTGEQLEETSKIFLSVMEKADPKLKSQLISQFKLAADSSPNSRSASPAPILSGRSSQHSTPHRSSSSHTHSTYTPDRTAASKPPAATAGPDSAPAKTYAEHRERSRHAVLADPSSKSRSHHVESPLARTDLKRPHQKDPHLAAGRGSSSNKLHDSTTHPPIPSQAYSNNPYTKQSRNHESSKSKHHRSHHGSSSTLDQSPLKKPRIAGENGNGEQRPPLPPQPPLPRLPPPP